MNTTSDAITEFFKQLTDLAGKGIIGIVIIIVIVTAYVILKQPPENRKTLAMFMSFCMVILIFLAVAGVGLVSENKVVKEKNDSLKTETQQLTQVNDTLEKTLQIQDVNLKAAQLTIAATQVKNPDELLPQLKEVNEALFIAKQTEPAFNKAAFTRAIINYENLASKIRADSFIKKEALPEFQKNYNAINAAFEK